MERTAGHGRLPCYCRLAAITTIEWGPAIIPLPAPDCRRHRFSSTSSPLRPLPFLIASPSNSLSGRHIHRSSYSNTPRTPSNARLPVIRRLPRVLLPGAFRSSLPPWPSYLPTSPWASPWALTACARRQTRACFRPRSARRPRRLHRRRKCHPSRLSYAPRHNPSPPSSQQTSQSGSPTPDAMRSSQNSDREGPPPAKRRRLTKAPKERTTDYLDLRSARGGSRRAGGTRSRPTRFA